MSWSHHHDRHSNCFVSRQKTLLREGTVLIHIQNHTRGYIPRSFKNIKLLSSPTFQRGISTFCGGRIWREHLAGESGIATSQDDSYEPWTNNSHFPFTPRAWSHTKSLLLPTTSLSALQPPQNALVPGNIICSNRPWNPWLHGASLQTTGDTSDQPDLSTDFRQHSPRSFHPQLRGRAGILLHMVLRWIWRCGRCIASIPSPVCKVSTINIHEK